MNSQTSENHFHLKTTRQPIKRVPPPGACPACQGFLENISHSSTDEGHSAATPDLWGDCRLSPTAHKLKCQLSGFLSQDNKDLPTVSNFPAFFEQIFQMNHLIKHKARLYANILYGIIKHILRKKLTYALETKNLQNIAYPPLDCLYKYMRALKDQLAFLIIQHIVPNTQRLLHGRSKHRQTPNRYFTHDRKCCNTHLQEIISCSKGNAEKHIFSESNL